MEKIAVDPRMVATPLGAAVGWALASKIYKGKATMDKKLIGAGAGLVAGYTVGEFLKADPPWQRPTGVRSQDRETLDSMLMERPGKVPLDTKTIELIENAYGSLLPDSDLNNPVVSKYLDQSVLTHAHKSVADRYRELARRAPDRRQDLARAAAEHDKEYARGLEQIRSNAKKIRNETWWRKFSGLVGGGGNI